MKTLIFTLLIITSVFASAQDIPFKKIRIVEGNNTVLNFNYKKLHLADSINSADLVALKEYVLEHTNIEANNDPEIYFELMKWVSQQWKHNGWNAAPDSLNSLGILKKVHNEGEAYRCVEYGTVLNDILKSFGYISRSIGVKHKDVDYGGAGMGHVATEVWSNTYNKWIFLDAQFGIYATKDGNPLNIYDIYLIKKAGDFNQIAFNVVTTGGLNDEYGNGFLTNYLGYIDISQTSNKLNYSLSLKMEGQNDYLTFQAFPSRKTIFTDNVNEVYYSLNQTMILIDYPEEEVNRAMGEFSKLEISTLDDFNKNMSLFAAQPKFKLSFDNNMPWFKEYKVFLNDVLVPIEDGHCLVNLNEGLNTIKAFAVNANGIEGIPSVLKIIYE
ncbi:hypothetical protein [Saccharicrinis aurantiacus]|uniref:hypothetical protein n=1 Tax=Saccharicrinis aurantiacus TaxID=1849719 RepID=UPI00094F8950|nr:hypothetical protein [Saccharicrinis aurantiacus]